MAKKFRRIFAIAMVMCMFVSVLPMQALAADSEPVTTYDGDLKTVTTVTTENSTPTVTIEIIKEETTGTANEVTPEYGAKAKVDKTVTTTTTTTEHEDGSLQSVSVIEGSETKSYEDVEVQPSQQVPSINLELKDGETTTGSASNADAPVVDTEGVEPGEGVDEYDWTVTETVTDRTATGTLDVDEGFAIDGMSSTLECPVGPEQYEGKNYNEWAVKGDPYRPGLAPNMGKDYVTDILGTPEKPEDDEHGRGYDFVWSGYGDVTESAIPVFFKEIVYLTDENGETVVDENGNPVIDMENSKFMTGKNNRAQNTGMVGQVGQFALKHVSGNYFYAYCMDQNTGTPEVGVWYQIRNIEDAIESEDNPDGYISEDEAAMIRAIAQNGYWGSDPNVMEEDANGNLGPQIGSIGYLKELMKKTYSEDSVVTVRYPGSDESHEVKIYELIDELSEHEALAVTQAAIWTFANPDDITYNQNSYGGLVTDGSVYGVLSGIKQFSSKGGRLDEYTPAKDLNSDARLLALYQCLISLDPIYAEDEDIRMDSQIIPDSDVIGDMALVIHDKVSDATSTDENGNSVETDVYNVDLTFQLAFVPVEGSDDLLVYLYGADNKIIEDKDGNPIIRRLAGTNDPDESYESIKAENGVYTLTGLQLGENTDYVFDLRLEGTQHLDKGVYIYQAKGGRNASQTLVGLAEGDQSIQANATMTLSFEVNENSDVVVEHIWREETDPIIIPAEGEEPEVFRFNNQDGAEEIPDEEVPLAAPVVTGSNSFVIWLTVVMAAMFGLAVLNLRIKRRPRGKHEAI